MFEITDVNQCVGEYIGEKFLPPPPPKKTATGSVILGRVLVTSVQLKRYHFRRLESFWGLVKIPRMCLLFVSFDHGVWFGCNEPPNKGHSIINTTPLSIISGKRKILSKSGS